MSSFTFNLQKCLRLSSMMCQTRNVYNMTPNRHRIMTRRRARNFKVLKVDLPDTEFQRKLDSGKVSNEEVKAHFKKIGKIPLIPIKERESTYISSTGAIFEPYVPQEGDGKSSILSKEGAKDSLKGVTGKGRSFMAVRKIRQYEEDFDPRNFVEQALNIYIQAHEALCEGDEENLFKYATEKAYPEMVYGMENKTVRWKFIKSLEPPKVVHVRQADVIQKHNVFAQVTVRFHTQQTLAVYDRFGRLMHGSEVVAKDVLEYVVFEKHLANFYGIWRLHGKIIPDWLPPRSVSNLTHVLEEDKETEERESEKEPKTEKETKEAEKDPKTKAKEEEEDVIYDKYGRIKGQ